MNNELVESNLNLVYFIVSREYPTYLHDEDIIQSGMLGLCKAAEKFDPNKGKFSTYAGRCIRNEINNEFINRKPHRKNISLETNIGEDGTLGDVLQGDDDVAYLDGSFIDSLTKEEQECLRLDSIGFSTAEISKKLKLPVSKVQKILRIIRLKWRSFCG